MRLALIGALCLLATGLVGVLFDISAVTQWALDQQRAFQNQMAGAVRALKAGEPGAYLTLFAATGAYGFVHALGPGHGKYLMSGVGLGSTVSAPRLVSIAAASSITQALWAILLVYGGFALLAITAQQMTLVAEDILAPASYIAIAAVGAVLIWRGARQFSLSRARPADTAHACADHDHTQHHGHHHGHDHGHDHHHGHDRSHGHAHDHHNHDHPHGHDEACGCGAHGPTAQEIAQATTLRETLALIFSVAIRPCTGAMFLLVIAWQMDLLLAGALAVMVMGLGTAGLTSLVAFSSVTARKLALATATTSAMQISVFSASQIFVGMALIWVSLGLLMIAF